MDTKLKLRKFDMNSVPEGKVVTMIGKRGNTSSPRSRLVMSRSGSVSSRLPKTASQWYSSRR